MEGDFKIVHYDEYCKTCVNKDKKESEDPCYDCLNEPGRVDSHRPARYEEKEK